MLFMVCENSRLKLEEMKTFFFVHEGLFLIGYWSYYVHIVVRHILANFRFWWVSWIFYFVNVLQKLISLLLKNRIWFIVSFVEFFEDDLSDWAHLLLWAMRCLEFLTSSWYGFFEVFIENCLQLCSSSCFSWWPLDGLCRFFNNSTFHLLEALFCGRGRLFYNFLTKNVQLAFEN